MVLELIERGEEVVVIDNLSSGGQQCGIVLRTSFSLRRRRSMTSRIPVSEDAIEPAGHASVQGRLPNAPGAAPLSGDIRYRLRHCGWNMRSRLYSLNRSDRGGSLNVRKAPRTVAASDPIRTALGWTPKHDNLDKIVTSALQWEEKLRRKNAKS
jgi:hypothetical protein